jgi:hypothetical protein
MIRRLTVFLVCLAVLIPPAVTQARTAPPAGVAKPFFTEQAQSLALANDPKIKRKNNEIVLKRMKHTEAIAALKAKAKNMQTFRWSPLLSFTFPQKLDLTLDYEMSFKPLNYQTEIITLTHERDDLTHEVKRKTEKLFISVYVYQERIIFQEQLLELTREDLRRNAARLVLGTALQADIDALQKSAEKQTADLAALKRSFELGKKDLSDITGLDVTSGYAFQNPLKTAFITRAQLAELTEYTLANDHLYYTARMAQSVARISLDTYEQLFSRQYGGKVDAISVFLNQARNGQNIDTAAFKISYDAMLKTFDQPWDGSYTLRLLFLRISFPMLWLKGQIDGTRYIEDETYALYTASLDYLAAHNETLQVERDLRREVSSQYESLITAKNAMDALLKTLEETKLSLERLIELNRRGKATFSDVRDKQSDYRDLQMDAVDALATYNHMLCDFDRLTCGGVHRLLTGTGLGVEAGGGGDSIADRPSYYIYTDVANLVFVFGVNIPDGYMPEMDSYEIWYENYRIGERTPVGREIRHLELNYGETHILTVRMFNNGEFVSECVIDTTVPTDILNLRGRVPEEPRERVLGGYTIETAQRATGAATSEITLTLYPGVEARYFRISFSGMGLYAGEHIPIDQPLKHLAVVAANLASAQVEFYDQDRQALYTARFEPMDQSIREL